MAFSIQTNVNSLLAQENLRVNSEFQSRTIQRLTSGFRINASGDDAAGLAVANKYRNDISELTQGVRNANDGISALQIVDGGLNNISQILDRLKTLATQSASSTFTGNRTTLNNEYQALLTEINRQANNVGLVSGGKYNSNISVYIGGGNVQSNAKVTVDLSGSANQVDAAGLGINSSSVAGGGSTLGATNAINTLNTTTATFVVGAGGTQSFTFQIYDTNLSTTGSVNVTVTGKAGGLLASDALSQLNNSLSQYGITASANSSGYLVFGGTRAFSASVNALGGGATSALATATANAENQAVYSYAAATYATVATAAQTLTFQNSAGSANVTLATGATLATAISSINAQTASLGIYAIYDNAATGLSIQSSSNFSLTSAGTSTAGVLAGGGSATITTPDTSATVTGGAEAALTSLATAVSNLGLVQGRVGTGQNKLQYSVLLAQSQISNFSTAQSRIRDADIAAEAADLTKAQVLQQASLAAMAQANSAPQAVLALLRG